MRPPAMAAIPWRNSGKNNLLDWVSHTGYVVIRKKTPTITQQALIIKSLTMSGLTFGKILKPKCQSLRYLK